MSETPATGEEGVPVANVVTVIEPAKDPEKSSKGSRSSKKSRSSKGSRRSKKSKDSKSSRRSKDSRRSTGSKHHKKSRRSSGGKERRRSSAAGKRHRKSTTDKKKKKRSETYDDGSKSKPTETPKTEDNTNIVDIAQLPVKMKAPKDVSTPPAPAEPSLNSSSSPPNTSTQSSSPASEEASSPKPATVTTIPSTSANAIGPSSGAYDSIQANSVLPRHTSSQSSTSSSIRALRLGARSALTGKGTEGLMMGGGGRATASSFSATVSGERPNPTATNLRFDDFSRTPMGSLVSADVSRMTRLIRVNKVKPLTAAADAHVFESNPSIFESLEPEKIKDGSFRKSGKGSSTARGEDTGTSIDAAIAEQEATKKEEEQLTGVRGLIRAAVVAKRKFPLVPPTAIRRQTGPSGAAEAAYAAAAVHDDDSTVPENSWGRYLGSAWKDWVYLLVLGLAVLVGTLAPNLFAYDGGVFVARISVRLIVTPLLFLVIGLGMPLEHLPSVTRDIRENIVAFAFSFIFMPFTAIAAGIFLETSTTDAGAPLLSLYFRSGIYAMAISAAAYRSVRVTEFGFGISDIAYYHVAWSQLIGLVYTPVMTLLIVETDAVNIDFSEKLTSLLLIVIVPAAFGLTIRGALLDALEGSLFPRTKAALTAIIVCSLFSTLNESPRVAEFTSSQILMVAVVALGAYWVWVLLLMMLTSSSSLCSFSFFPIRDRIGVIFAGSEKALPITVGVIYALYGSLPLAAVLVLPLLFFRAYHVVFDAFLALQLKATVELRIAEERLRIARESASTMGTLPRNTLEDFHRMQAAASIDHSML